MSEMVEAKGYFIYYDKNRGMQEYILDNRLTGVRGFRGKSTPDDNHEKREKHESAEAAHDRGSAPFAKRTETVRGTGARAIGSSEYKKLVNMLVSLSAVLFIICFLMGAGIIQSDGKISELERDMNALNNAFGYVLGQVNTMGQQLAQTQTAIHAFSQNQAQPVFAPGDAAIQPTPAPTPLAQNEAPTQTPEPQRQSSDVHLPQATIPPTQPPFNISTFNTPVPTQTPGRGLTHEQAMAAMIELSGGFDTYTVQRGDTLSGISIRYYGTTDMIETIMEVNGITHPDMIFFGRTLLMPRLESAEDDNSNRDE
jgi:LysM repeat protein